MDAEAALNMRVTHLSRAVTPQAQLRIGIGGHCYVISTRREAVLEVAKALGRSPRGVYYRKEYGCWALRIRRDRDKRAVKQLFGRAATAQQALC